MNDRASRFATRFLLFGEIIMGWVSASWAVSALWGAGEWWKTFNDGGASLWAWGLLLAGIAQCAVAVLEMVSGRGWSDNKLMYAAEARHILGVVSCVVWTSMLIHYFQTNPYIAAPAIVMQALVLICGNAIVVVNNKRLSVLLDPSIPTEQLRSKLLDARNDGKMVL